MTDMPLLFRHTAPLFGVWQIEEDDGTLFALLRNGELYARQLADLHADGRRKEWLACRVLLQELLDCDVVVGYRSDGAPFLQDSPFSVSFSHTKGYAAALVSPNPPVGIDIEYRSDRVRKIRHRFMRKEEEAAIDPLHEADHLLLHWCAKETLFKMLGVREADFAKHLHVFPFPFAGQGRFYGKETLTPEEKTFALDYLVCDGFIIVWSAGENRDKEASGG